MKDTVSCTGIYKENYDIQLTPRTLYIRVQGGLQGVMLRFGDQPARPLRLAEEMEKKIRSIIITGSEFNDLADSNRLRYQVSTLVSGIKSDDLDLSGIQEALANIRAGCPLPGGSAPAAKPAAPTGSMCSAMLVERMRGQGIRDDQIEAICR